MNDAAPAWSLRVAPREWQRQSLAKWLPSTLGVASVVTGGGKTVFAFLCMQEFRKQNAVGRIVILVPTMTLLDQWYVWLQEDFGVPLDQIACHSSQGKPRKPAAVNVLVINTAREMARKLIDGRTFLIVDECHRLGSPKNAKALQGDYTAALGLSVTPQR